MLLVPRSRFSSGGYTCRRVGSIAPVQAEVTRHLDSTGGAGVTPPGPTQSHGHPLNVPSKRLAPGHPIIRCQGAPDGVTGSLPWTFSARLGIRISPPSPSVPSPSSPICFLACTDSQSGRYEGLPSPDVIQSKKKQELISYLSKMLHFLLSLRTQPALSVI